MSTERPLDARKRLILQAAVQEFILNAEPVGSQKLVQKYHLDVSPATARNELAALEDLGYLHQPHTSAGRVPTDQGYRHFVDTLASKPGLTQEQAQIVDRIFSALNREMEGLLHETSLLLAKLTSYVAVVLAPKLRRSTLKHLDLVSLSSDSLLVVIITNTGWVAKNQLSLEKPCDDATIHQVEQILNEHLESLTHKEMVDIKDKMRELSPEISSLAEKILDQIIDCFSEQESERVFLEGASRLVYQPEFEDMQRVQTLLSTLERGYSLLQWLEDSLKTKKVLVRIGSENEEAAIKEYSVVASSYRVGNENYGTLGIIGPTRMDYGKVISTVEYIADNLSKALSSLR